MVEPVSSLVAFGAGVLSFLSPCVVPLVPVYFASLSGPEILEHKGNKFRLSIFLHSLSFVLGFALVFATLGAIAGLTGFVLSPNQALLNKLAGSLLMAFGLYLLVAWKLPWLNYARYFTPSLGTTTGYLRSFLTGAVFSSAWIACAGIILGGILALALNSATAWRGAYLLALYSLGLGVPFLGIGLAFDTLSPLLKRVSRYSGLLHVISALLLIVVGGLILANKLVWFASLAA